MPGETDISVASPLERPLGKSEILRLEEESASSFQRRWLEVVGSHYFPFALQLLGHGENPTMAFGLNRLPEVTICKVEMSGAMSATGWRSPRMIRENNTRLFLIWLTLVGRYETQQEGRHFVADERQVAIMRSDRPFRMNVYPDADGNHLSYQVVVPLSRMYELFPDVDAYCALSHRMEGPGYVMVRDLFTSLYQDGERMHEALAGHLAMSALDGLKLLLHRSTLPDPDRREEALRPSSDKAREVMRLTDHFATDPDVTPARIADQCGISKRQLHRIFKAFGHTFMHHVMDIRLERARRLLDDPDFGTMPIGEISFLVGFNSHSHFDRQFRRKFGCSPKAVRT